MKSTTWLVASAFLFGLLIGQPATAQVDRPIFKSLTDSPFGNLCAIDQLNRLWCNGQNRNGELGYERDALNSSKDFVKLPTELRFLQVAGTCAISVDLYVYCWGPNSRGQLGNGTVTPNISTTPIKVDGIENAKQIVWDASDDFYCAILIDGTGNCWGNANHFWQMVGLDGPVPGPEPFTKPMLITEIKSMEWMFSWGDAYITKVVLHKDGKISYTGTGKFGALPGELIGIDNVVKVSSSYNSACAIRIDKTLWCWGSNHYGQLGSGNYLPSWTPQKVLGLDNIIDVSVGTRHVCAISHDGKTYCWGENTSNQINNSDTRYFNSPVEAFQGIQAQLINTSIDVTYILDEAGVIKRTYPKATNPETWINAIRSTNLNLPTSINVKTMNTSKTKITWANLNNKYTTPIGYSWRIKKQNSKSWTKWKSIKKLSPTQVVLNLKSGKYVFQIQAASSVFRIGPKTFKFIVN